MTDEKYYLSAARLAELKNELEELKGVKRQEVANRLKQAKEYGDLSENSEYTEAREEQGRVETRIFELEELLKNAEVMKKGATDAVGVGSTVTIKKGDQTMAYTIVSAYEANPTEGKISDESPLGEAFLHHKVGDSVAVKTPKGVETYLVSKIE